MGSRTILAITVGAALTIGAGNASAQARSGQGGAPPAGQPSSSSSAPAASPMLKAADKAFLTKAAMGGEAEVELGTLAQQKAANPQVKALGERLETDHKKANADLRAIIVSRGLNVPGGPDKAHQAEKTRLEKLQGASFDQAYTAAMVSDHTKDIKEFETAAKSSDPAIKEFAEKTLPTLREHLKMAQEAKAAVGAGAMSSRSTGGSGTAGTAGKTGQTSQPGSGNSGAPAGR